MTHLNTPNAWFQALTAYQPADGLLATPSRQESQIRVRLDNIGSQALKMDEWLLFDGQAADPLAPIYGEGFQMLAQTAGVWSQPQAIGRCPDAAMTYRFKQENDTGFLDLFRHFIPFAEPISVLKIRTQTIIKGY